MEQFVKVVERSYKEQRLITASVAAFDKLHSTVRLGYVDLDLGLITRGAAGRRLWRHRVAALTLPPTPRYIQGNSPSAPEATLESIPGACVLVCSLYIHRLWKRLYTSSVAAFDLLQSTVRLRLRYEEI